MVSGGGGAAAASGKSKKEYAGRLTWYVGVTCVVAAMGGLIFGYDMGISGGVTSMAPFLKKFFPRVERMMMEDTAKSSSQYCKFSDGMLTLFTSSLYLAALGSSLAASWFPASWGRRKPMLAGGAVFCCGAVLNAFSQTIWMLIIGRVLLGFGVGLATQSVPLFVSEMAPHKHRGALSVCFQLSITVGILAANLVNFFTNKIGGDLGWRISLGGAAVPALFMVVSSLLVCDTPNSLVEREEFDEANKLLQRIRGVEDVKPELDDLIAASYASKQVKHPWKNLFTMRRYRPQLVLAILIPMFQQLSGINVVMFYAPELFRTIGFKDDASLMSALITGGFNVLATFFSLYGTDRLGRKYLFILGGTIMLVFQAAVGGLIGYKFGWSGNATTDIGLAYSVVVVSCICAFVVAFAFSWGPLAWLVPSEIFPLEIRSAGQSLVVGVNMLFTFVVAQLFLSALCAFKYVLFIIFAVIVLIMTLFVIFFVPETMNIPIEEMSTVWRNHWYWKRFVDDDDQDPEAA